METLPSYSTSIVRRKNTKSKRYTDSCLLLHRSLARERKNSYSSLHSQASTARFHRKALFLDTIPKLAFSQPDMPSNNRQSGSSSLTSSTAVAAAEQKMTTSSTGKFIFPLKIYSSFLLLFRSSGTHCGSFSEHRRSACHGHTIIAAAISFTRC